MSTDWKWPGSRWWRVDLHAHTPASYDDRSGSGPERDWAGWVTAARDSGLDAVAITDHNTAEAVDAIQEAAAGVENAPVLFPGVELTASGGWHLLVLLDPSRRQEHVEELLSRVGIRPGRRGERTTQSPHSVEAILDELGDEALILGAHANCSRGLLELCGEQRNKVLKHPGLAGVEINPRQESEEKWLDGSIPEVARRIPRIWASDGHSPGDVGRRFTWVKMTKPNLEGLRLALLDGADSLKPVTRAEPGNPNTHADLAIESVSVNSAKYIGQSDRMTVEFSPWLNAIIGGRGTGKSTLVDLCRKTLRRESELDDREGGEEGPLREYFDRRMSVPASRRGEGLLTDETLIEVVYRKDGERFVLSWSQMGDVHPIARLDASERSAQVGDISERFPVRIYSQKQLFGLARDQNALLTVIDDSPTVHRVESDRTLDRLRNRYLSRCAEAREARNRAGELPSRQAELDDITNKLEVLQEGGHAQVWKEYRMLRRHDDTWQAILRGVERAVEEVRRSSDDLSVSDLHPGVTAEGDQAVVSLRRGHESLRRAVDSLQQGVREAVEQTRQDIEEIRSGPDGEQWSSALAASERAFRLAAAQLADKGIADPDQYTSLLEGAANLRREIEGLKAEEKRAANLESEAEAALREYRRHQRELTERRRTFTEETSSDTIRVEVAGLSENERLLNYLGQCLGTERYEKDLERIADRIRGEQSEIWDWRRLDSVVEEIRRIHSGEPGASQARDRRFESFLKKARPESMDRLALYRPEDTVEVTFRDDASSTWKPLDQGSPGQQTAALLAFVLGYGEEPILLDQPEDDLDNTLIYELVVTRLRETKLKRQVIVVTHNPNIVVHGDAELVLSLEAGSGESRIACQGGLQERRVRDEICRVMEGGLEAFRRRYRRIMPSEASGA